MEALEGIPLTQKRALEQEGIDREEILRQGIRAYLKMVYRDGFFHGDLHAGNLFILPNNKLGLVDFGVVGRLNRRTQDSIADMFVALAEEDFDKMASIYIDLAPFTETIDADGFARDVQNLLAPYLGLTMKHVNVGRLLMESTSIAMQHGLILPSRALLFFKSIVPVIERGWDVHLKRLRLFGESLAFAKEEMQKTPDPKELIYDAAFFARDVQSLLRTAPRQMKFALRRLNDPGFHWKVHSPDSEALRRTVEKGFSQVFWGLIFAALILGLLLHYR